jgi:hypothetical protein
MAGTFEGKRADCAFKRLKNQLTSWPRDRHDRRLRKRRIRAGVQDDLGKQRHELGKARLVRPFVHEGR